MFEHRNALRSAIDISLVAHKPYEPSDGFFAVRTIWLMAHKTHETVFDLAVLAFILAMYHLYIPAGVELRWQPLKPKIIHSSLFVLS
jgi:hypothetical protein